MSLKEFQEDMAREFFGMTTKEAKESGHCIKCRQLALPNCYSEAGRKEYKISGLCEKCFDEITRGE